MMKIKAIELTEINLPLVHFFETSFGRTYERRIILVRVTDEDGAMGWGEVLSNNTWNLATQADYSADSFGKAFSHMGDNVSTLGQVGEYLVSGDTPDQSGLGSMFLPDTGVAAKVAEIQQAKQSAGGQ